MKDRIRAVRKMLGLNQGEFAEKLGVSKSSAQKWDIGAAVPNAATLRLMADMFGVSEAWLKTGEGDMLRPMTEEEELTAFVADICREDAPEFRRRLVYVLSRLYDAGWNVIEKIVENLNEKRD